MVVISFIRSRFGSSAECREQASSSTMSSTSVLIFLLLVTGSGGDTKFDELEGQIGQTARLAIDNLNRIGRLETRFEKVMLKEVLRLQQQLQQLQQQLQQQQYDEDEHQQKDKQNYKFEL